MNEELTNDELSNSWVSKLLISNNEDLKNEIDNYKKDIKRLQNAFEKLREKFTKVEKELEIYKNKNKYNIILEIMKIILSIFLIWLFTNILSSNIQNIYLWIVSIFLVILYILIILYEYLKNK